MELKEELAIINFGVKAYSKWASMINRCNNGWAEVCEEWKTFEGFYPFFKENYVEGWELDKDLLSPPNKKIYSKDTCAFLPQSLNGRLRSYMTGKPKFDHIIEISGYLTECGDNLSPKAKQKLIEIKNTTKEKLNKILLES